MHLNTKARSFISKKRRQRFAEGSSLEPHSLIPREFNLACVLSYVYIYILIVAEHMSNAKNPACVGYIGDYTTQIYREYNKPF